MIWPWSRRPAPVETRASYTDATTAALLAAAEGSTKADPSTLGALEVCAGTWARAFASARVEPQTPITAAVTPAVLATIGRQLIRRGEALHVIDVDPSTGRVDLLDSGSWEVHGGLSRSTWHVRATLAGPDVSVSRDVPYAAVSHVCYAVDPYRPWLGVSPLSWAVSTGRLAAALERALGDESGGPVGAVLPVPEGQPEPDDDDETAPDPLAALRADLGNLRGTVALVETLAGGWGDKGGRPDSDWKPRRVGANPPASLAELRTGAALTVFGACGVPPSLVTLPADGTGQREAWRRFMHGSVSPVARLVETELRAKLDTPDLRLDFADLYAADLMGRARAWRSLVGKGAEMDPDKAARLAGLET